MFRRHAVHSEEGDLLCAPEQLAMRSDRDGHAHVVELIGELDINTAPAFDAELKRVERSDAREIIVDLSGLTSISCDGLKALIHANARSRDCHKRLRLLRGTDQVQRTFETAGLVTRLPFDDDRELNLLLHSRPPRARVVVSRPVRNWCRSTR